MTATAEVEQAECFLCGRVEPVHEWAFDGDGPYAVSAVCWVANQFMSESAGDHPETARGECFAESERFVAALAAVGVEAEVVSGFTFIAPGIIGNGHAGANVGGTVYDWTARQFAPHDQDWPLVQPLAQWRETWRVLV